MAGPESNYPNPDDKISEISNAPVLLPVPSDPTISFRLWFRVGSQDDPAGKEGLAAVTAAMLTEGATQSNGYEKIVDKLFPLAAGYGASVSAEMTVVSGRVHRDNLDRFYPLLIEAVRDPAFRQADLDRIKARTLNYLENTLRFADNEELGKTVLSTSIFAGTPYGHLTEGTVQSVRGLTLDDVRNFYRAITPAGTSSSALAAATMRRCSNGCKAIWPVCLPVAGADRAAPAEADSRPPRNDRRKRLGATAVSVGFPMDRGARRGTKDWYALAVANAWLGQHRNQHGHLYQVIREAAGAELRRLHVHRAYSTLGLGGCAVGEQLPPPADFRDMAPAGSEAARSIALRAALREFQAVVDHGLTEAEFQETRQFLRKFVLHLAPTTMDRLGYGWTTVFTGSTARIWKIPPRDGRVDRGRCERGDPKVLAVRESGDCPGDAG